MSKENVKVTAYRYMWKVEGSENLNIKMIVGVQEEHEKFIEAIKNDNKVKCASRVYLHEYDIMKVEMYDMIKKEGD